MAVQPLTVVAIDDDQTDLRILRRTLERAGPWDIRFEGFSDPAEGIRALRDGLGDIVFLDYLLGGQTGLQVLKALRHDADRRPVIVLTGHGDEYVAAELMRNGANGYVVKHDLSPPSLRLAIENALRESALETQNLHLQEQLEAARKMEAIGTLAGGLAHDFNNILTGIIGTAELCLAYHETGKLTPHLEMIKSECYRMSELIRQLVQFSRSGANADGPIDLVPVIAETAEQFRATLADDVAFEVHLPSEPQIVQANRAAIEQILRNLCNNAAEAVAGRGKIVVRVRRLRPDPEFLQDRLGLSHSVYALIEVHDDGPGIAPEIRERIFEPFFTTKPLGSVKGTGLGLAMVWQAARQFDGRVHCYSELHKGTTFRVYLPCHESTVDESETVPASALHGEAVLVVDDEPIILRVVSRMLERLGYEVITAESGSVALDALEKIHERTSLVIMDMSMPGLSGLESLRRIRTNGWQVPVLMSSGHNLDDQVDKLMAEGAQGFIQKPYQLAELADRVRRLLDPARHV